MRNAEIFGLGFVYVDKGSGVVVFLRTMIPRCSLFFKVEHVE